MSSSKRARAPRGGRGTSSNNHAGQGRSRTGNSTPGLGQDRPSNNTPGSGPLGSCSTRSNDLNPDIDPSLQNTVSTSLLL